MIDNTLRVARLEREVRWLRVIVLVACVIAVAASIAAYRALRPSQLRLGGMTLTEGAISFESPNGRTVTTIDATGMELRTREHRARYVSSGFRIVSVDGTLTLPEVNLVVDGDRAWFAIAGKEHSARLAVGDDVVIEADNKRVNPEAP